jgi:dihydrofolate reductase
MSKVRVHNFVVTLDGYSTGEGQSLEAPFGHAQDRFNPWFGATHTWRQELGGAPGSGGFEEAVASTWEQGIGAEIMGRNKFGPQRGPWENHDWRGWWGENPVYHTPCFILTHYPRPSITLEGGTTFHFLDATPAEALAAAREAAGDLDVRIGGGPSTLRAFLEADLVDYLDLVIIPIVIGGGIRLWEGLDRLEERFHVESLTMPSGATHVTLSR